MEEAAGMVVDGTAAAGMGDGGVAGAVGVVVGTEAGGMAEVGGPDMATAGMVLVILIGAGTAAVGGRVGVADGGVVSTEAGTAVTGVSPKSIFIEPLAFGGGSDRLILVQAFSNPLGVDLDKKADSAGLIRIFGFR
jgi:hypothetical protein